MQGPSDRIRNYVSVEMEAASASDEVTSGGEDTLEGVLLTICAELESDIDTSNLNAYTREDATDQLAAVQSWAALASQATAMLYAPTSPWRRQLAGWGKKIATVLQTIVNILYGAVNAAAKTLGAASYSLGSAFPFSAVSVSVSWPVV